MDFLKLVLSNTIFIFVLRRKRAAEQKAESLKNSVLESFNQISSSMSAVMTRNDSKAKQPGPFGGRGTGVAGPRGPGVGRGAGRGIGRGKSRGRVIGPGKGVGRPAGSPNNPGVKTPLLNSKGKPEKKQKKKNQKKVKDTGAVSLDYLLTL